MYKLQTQLANFRFNSIVHQGPLTVEWFVYLDDMDGDDSRGFTYEELGVFQTYTVNNQVNFPGVKNYHTVENSTTPNCSLYNLIPTDRIHFPENVILTNNPDLVSEHIQTCMEILLVNYNGTSNHKYELGFNVVGKIIV